MAGTLVGTDDWFSHLSRQFSSNYGIGLNGEVHQYVADENMAWANGGVQNPTAQVVKDNLNVNQNKISLSVECEGYDLCKAPETQLNALVGLIRGLATKYNIPLDRYHIIGHREITTNKPTCPSSDNQILDKIVQMCQVQQPQTPKQLLLEIEERVNKLKSLI